MDILEKKEGQTYVEAFIGKIKVLLSKEPEILAHKFEESFRSIQSLKDYENPQDVLVSYSDFYSKNLSEVALRRATVGYLDQIKREFATIFNESPTKVELSVKEMILNALERVKGELERIRKNRIIKEKLEKIDEDFSDEVKGSEAEAETSNKKKGSLCSQFFYRGHAKSDWPLIPLALRDCICKDENFFYQEMLRLEPSSFSDKTEFDRLAIMQHYGCPTRLLDVSFNPLVSLYFACNVKPDDDGVVYVFNKLDFVHSDDRAVNALAKMALLTPLEKEEFEKDLKKDALSTSHSYGRIMENMDLEGHFFVEPILVKPKFLAPRIKQQAGAFAIAPFDGQKVDGFMRSICCKKIVIPAKAKGEILEELDQLCINEMYLFDGLEHTANYLKTRN